MSFLPTLTHTLRLFVDVLHVLCYALIHCGDLALLLTVLPFEKDQYDEHADQPHSDSD